MAFTENVEFVAFDLETTGLSSAFCHIVEFGAVRFRADGTELDRLEQLVDPGCPVPRDATAVHGITNDMIRGQPTVEEVLPEFLQFLGGTDTILMAHNASFDLGFLAVALHRLGANVPEHPVVDIVPSKAWERGMRCKEATLKLFVGTLRVESPSGSA